MSSAAGLTTDVESFINDASAQAASWYTAFNPTTPVVVPGSIGTVQAQQQATAQAALTATNPVLSGILANPGFLLIVIGGLVLVALWIFYGRK